MAKKKANLESYASWRRSLIGGVTFAGVYSVLAYIFVSLAIDSGSLWQYLLAIVSIVMAFQSIVMAIKNRVNGTKK